MNISKRIALYVTSSLMIASIALTVSAQNYPATGTPARLRNFSTTTRAANMAARQATMIQKGMTRGDNMIGARITSLNDLLTKIEAMKNVSDTDKASITTTVQNVIASLTSLQSKIASDTSTTSIKADVSSITADYRIYALVQPQISILAAADRINQIVSLMSVVESKLQTRITALQSSGVDTSSLTSAMSDIASKITDATTQATNAVSSTASLTPDQGNATVAASNTASLKAARTNIKTGNTDLQAARKDMNAVLLGIRSLIPKTGMLRTINGTTTAPTTSGTPITQ